MNYLKHSKLKSQAEKYVRIQAWWKCNDKRRNNKKEIPLSKIEIENLQELLKLFNDDDQNDCLLKAEVYRELGEYSKSLYSLNRVVFEGISDSVFLIRELIFLNNQFVSEIL